MEKISGNNGSELRTREKWSNKLQFLFGCIGFSVGLGNVWRFPYLCYKNGGGAFLIPYFICVLIGAVPMFMLEIAMGQWTSQGTVSCWNHFCPLLKGIGLAMLFIIFLSNTYYCVIMAWSFHYLFASFTAELPWASCDHTWNTPSCSSAYGGNTTNSTSVFYEATTGEYNDSLTAAVKVSKSDPATEYWQHEVLKISSGIDDVGVLQWKIVLCLLLAWTLTYLALFKGLKITGKILYVTTTTPYVFMIILLIRGLTLPGSLEGVKYYLLPDTEKLTDPEVWENAGSQVYYSYSTGVGILTALGSYNEFHHNFRRHSVIFAFINSFTSFLAGFVIFTVLGFMSYETNIPISEVAESGPGLAFIAYPKAVAQLPGAPVWSVLFFIFLILLGMDSLFGGIEAFMTAVIDLFPRQLRRRGGREVTLAVLVIVSALLGLTMCTNGGIYVFLIFDNYSQARTVIIVGFIQMATVSWIYGVNRFYDHVEVMLGFRIGIWIKICWAVLSPLFNLILSVLVFVNYSEVTYNNEYTYPAWGLGIGWLMATTSLSLIPIYMLYAILTTKGTLRQRLTKLMTPRPVVVDGVVRGQDPGTADPTLGDTKQPMLTTTA